MKKYLLLIAITIFTLIGFSQKPIFDKQNLKPQKGFDEAIKASPTAMAPAQFQQQAAMAAPGDVLWYEDFANGLSGNNSSTNPAWSRGDNGSGFSYLWLHDNQGPQGQYENGTGGLASSSSGNGWMLFDVNFQTDNDPNTDADGFLLIDGYLQSPAIDVSGFSTASVGLSIEHYYRTCCSGSTYPANIFAGYVDDISGLVWTQINSGNNQYETPHNLYPGAGDQNVEKRVMNVSSIVSNAKAQSNNNSVYLRFHWNADQILSNSYYFWMIDDVSLIEINDFDGKVNKIYAGDIYNSYEPYIIPIDQSHNFITGADVSNVGGNNLSNCHLDVQITEDFSGNMVYLGSSSSGTLTTTQPDIYFYNEASLGNLQFYHNTNLNSFNIGVHTLQVSLDADIDNDISNNTLTRKFEYSQYEYGHFDPNGWDNTFSGGNTTAGTRTLFELYQIFNDDIVYGIYLDIADYIDPDDANDNIIVTEGQTITIGIYDQSLSAIQTMDYTLTANEINTGRVAFGLPGVNVYSGDIIYAGVTFYSGNAFLVKSEPDGDSDNTSLIYYGSNGNYYGSSSDYYINLSFDPSIKPCASLESPSVSSSNTNLLCGSETINIQATGASLSTGANWVLYETGCGSGLLASNTSGVFNVTPSSTTTYFIRAEGTGCVSSKCDQVTINYSTDLTDPVPNSSTLSNLTSLCSITSLVSPTATDNCDGTILATTDASLPITSSTTITWTYQDAAGNSTTQTQTITITDAQAPIANNSSLPNITEDCEVTSLTIPTASDNCSGTVNGVSNITLPITETTTITWSYTDNNGNTSSQTQQVIINDVTAPVPDKSSLTDINAECEVASLTPPTATDVCSGSITATTDQTFPITNEGTTVVTWTFTDAAGNIATQSQNIIITCTSVSLEENTQNNFSVYPNPTKNSLTIQLSQLANTGYTITDQLGKVVKEGNISSQKQDIDVTDLAKGVYVITVGVVNQKFIKE